MNEKLHLCNCFLRMKTNVFSLREYNLGILKRIKTYVIVGCFGLSCLLGFAFPLNAQITAPLSDHQASIGYLSALDPDPLFIFYRDEGNNDAASLTANPPVAGTSSFVWSRYDAGSSSWTVIATHTDQASSSLSGLDEGGYEVHITNGSGLDTVFRAWVMIDHLVVNVDKTDDGNTKRYNYSCDFLILSAEVEVDSFFYYDPLTHEQLSLDNGFTFTWTSDNSDNKIYNPSSVLSPNTTYNPPVKNTQYVLTVTDMMGMTVDDSVYYQSINTKASFTVEYLDKTEDPQVFTTSPQYTDAPLTVKFLNESENGYEFEWIFVDTADAAYREYSFTYSVDDSPEFIYYQADQYYSPVLISHSLDPLALEGCTDTFMLESAIYVDASVLEIPNVFSPNDDGVNDYFIFKHESIKECRLTIIDRFGKVVYRIKIEDIYSWEGWNGKVLNSERDAPEGPYYYVVEALGYDDVEYDDPNIIEQWKTNRQTSGSSSTTTESGSTSTLYTGWVYIYRDKGEY